MRRVVPVAALLACAMLPLHAQQRLVATQELRIDAADAGITKGGGMLIARNGDILVVDDDDNIFRVFNNKGRAGTIGRVGEGPGEFRNLRSAGWIGDSLWTYDPQLKRVSIFGPDRKFVRSFIPANSVIVPGAARDTSPAELYPQALYADGTLRTIATYRYGTHPSWAAGVDSGWIIELRLGPDGKLKNRAAVLPPRKCSISKPRTGGGAYFLYTPFCHPSMISDWGTTPDNIVNSVEMVSANGHVTGYRVSSFNERGITVFSRVYPATPVAVTKSALDSLWAARQLSWAKNRGITPEYIAFAKALPPLKEYEPVNRIVNGIDGTIWVEERSAKPGHWWKVLDAKGNTLGTVTLSGNVELQTANHDYIWGYDVDSDGLQSVVRFRVGPPKG